MNYSTDPAYRTVLIIGAHNPTGRSLIELLSDERLVFLIGSRSLQKASGLCAEFDHRNAILTPVEFDYSALSVERVEELRPDVIVDASNSLTLSFLELSQICSLLKIAFLDLSSDGVRKLRSQMVPANQIDQSVPCGLAALVQICLRRLVRHCSDPLHLRFMTAISLSKDALFGERDWFGYLDFLEGSENVGRVEPLTVWSGTVYRPLSKAYLQLFTGRLSIHPSHTGEGYQVGAFEAGAFEGTTFLQLSQLARIVRTWLPRAAAVFELAFRLSAEKDHCELIIDVEERGQSSESCGIAFFGTDMQFGFLPSLSAAVLIQFLLREGQCFVQEQGIPEISFEALKPLLDKAGLKHEFYWPQEAIPSRAGALGEILGERFTELAPILQTINGSSAEANGEVSVASSRNLLSKLFNILILKRPKSGLAVPFKLTMEPSMGGTEVCQIFNQDLMLRSHCVAGKGKDRGLLLIHFGAFTFAMSVVPSSLDVSSGTQQAARWQLNFDVNHWFFHKTRLPRWLAPNFIITQEACGDMVKFSVSFDIAYLNVSSVYSGCLRLLDDQ